MKTPWLDDKEIKIMKNLILVVFIIVAFSPPCMAEVVEPFGFLGLSGTLWEPQIEIEFLYGGFYKGKLYSVTSDGICLHELNGSYIDLLFFSVFRSEYSGMYVSNGILSSFLGIGFLTVKVPDPDAGEPIIVRGVLKKVSDKWYPEDCM